MLFAIYVELFKSLKNVECNIECPATTTFIMMHHYLTYTIVIMDITAFVAVIYICICIVSGNPISAIRSFSVIAQ